MQILVSQLVVGLFRVALVQVLRKPLSQLIDVLITFTLLFLELYFLLSGYKVLMIAVLTLVPEGLVDHFGDWGVPTACVKVGLGFSSLQVLTFNSLHIAPRIRDKVWFYRYQETS